MFRIVSPGNGEEAGEMSFSRAAKKNTGQEDNGGTQCCQRPGIRGFPSR